MTQAIEHRSASTDGDLLPRRPDTVPVPITDRSLEKRCVWLTSMAGALLAASSFGGLVSDGTYLDFTTSLHMAESQGQDLVSLFVVLPLLAVAVRRARRGERGGAAMWAGGLAYVAYVQVLYAFGGVYSVFFLLYVATLGLALFALGGLAFGAARAAAEAPGPISRTSIAVYLLVTSALLGLIWVGMALQGISEVEAADANAIIVTDLIVVLPVSVLAAIGLVRRRRWAPLTAASVLVFDAVLGLSIIAGQLVAYLRGMDPVWGLGAFFLLFTIIGYRLAKSLVWALDHDEPRPKRSHRRRWVWGVVVAVVVGGGYLGLESFKGGIGHDLTTLTWSEAFDAAHTELVAMYPFTDWKKLDWDAAYAEFAPRIAAAQAADDFDAYYVAMREYAHAIPDSHVNLGGDDRGLRDQAVGGGYGLGIIELGDGRVIAHVVEPGGPAAEAGIAWGDEIVVWDGMPIDQALAESPILWAETVPATDAARRIQQLQYVVRGPVGGKAVVGFASGGGTTHSATLEAVDDEYATLNAAAVHAVKSGNPLDIFTTKLVTSEILASGYGYIDVDSFMFSARQPRVAAAFGWIISDFVADDVPGIIIDARGNQGGLDAAGVSMLSHFINEPVFYQDLAPVVDGNLVIDSERRDIIEPSDVVFDGPVVVLVDSHTLSVGEGLPMIMQRLPQGTVIGMESTGAAFAQGDFDALFRLPDGLVFSFLERASLDAEGNVQVDSDATGTGGITPDVVIPMTEANLAAIFSDGTDVVLETAVDYLNGNG